MIMRYLILFLVAWFPVLVFAQIKPDTIYTIRPQRDTLIGVSVKAGETVRFDIKKVKSATRTPWMNFKDKLEVRQTFQNKKDREEAAFISLVYPRDSVKSKNFSFAVGYNLWAYEREPQLIPYFEWQANTLAAKKQDAIFAGLAFQAPLRKTSKPIQFLTVYALTAINYKKDDVKNTKGTQANFYLSPVFGKTELPLPDVEFDKIHKVLKLIYNIYGGIEYENRAKTKDPLHAGTVWRWLFKANAKLYPFYTVIKGKLEVVPEIACRNRFSGTTTIEKKVNIQKKISFNIIILDKSKDKAGFDLKLGFDHTQGADPTKGFDDQRVNTLTLKVKF